MRRAVQRRAKGTRADRAASTSPRRLLSGPRTWRWLHWVATDADGWPDPLPLETFGDLPQPGALPP